MGNLNNHPRYIDEFVKRDTSRLLLPIFPNAKEITESFGAFNAAREHLIKELFCGYRDDVDVFCVGDGASPRTSSVFATRTKWQVFCIDPNLKNKSWRINRLQCYSCRIEDFKYKIAWSNSPKGKIAIIVLVHAHVDVARTIQAIESSKGDNKEYEAIHVISIECCVPHALKKIKNNTIQIIEPCVKYVDLSIWSEKNTVKIWRNVQNVYAKPCEILKVKNSQI